MTIYRSRIKKACPVCGELFSVFPYQIKKGQGNYCSIKCYYKENKRNPNNTDLERECYVCKIVKNKNEFYKNKANSYGVTDECKICISKLQKKKNYEARKKFIEEKNNMCEICGKQHKDISFFEIDHIIPLHKSKKSRTNLYSSSTKFYELQVLCPNCHKEKTIKENREAQNLKRV